MSDFSNEYKDYWEKTSKSLADYVQQRRVEDVENLISTTLSFLAFSTENLPTKTTKNNPDQDKLNAYIIIAIDSLRSLLRCQEELSLIGLVLLNRTAFEIHCNIKYMFQHPTPSIMIDRNFRFSDVEKFRHSTQPKSDIFLTPAEIIRIKNNCPEWFTVADGKLRKDNFHWTADKGKNFREIAKILEMEKDYISLYSTNSKFVHGSALTINMYKDETGNLHFNGRPQTCAMISIIACKYWLDTFEIYCEYFGISLNKDDLILLKENFLIMVTKYH